MPISKELQIGKAGEYLVCADLILRGYIAYPSEQGLPYDVVMDTGDRLLKIQVKSTLCPRVLPQRAGDSKAYIFNIKRHGKNNSKKYSDNDVDIFALCALDTKKVGYLKNNEMPSTLNLRVDSLRGEYYDEKGIRQHKEALGLYNEGFNRSEISKKLGIHYSTVSRFLSDGYKPHITNARYFSDIVVPDSWFMSI